MYQNCNCILCCCMYKHLLLHCCRLLARPSLLDTYLDTHFINCSQPSPGLMMIYWPCCLFQMQRKHKEFLFLLHHNHDSLTGVHTPLHKLTEQVCMQLALSLWTYCKELMWLCSWAVPCSSSVWRTLSISIQSELDELEEVGHQPVPEPRYHPLVSSESSHSISDKENWTSEIYCNMSCHFYLACVYMVLHHDIFAFIVEQFY